MQILSQRDPRWGNIKVGTSDSLIKDIGCTITCLAMILDTTPDIVNQRLKSLPPDANGNTGYAQGNLVYWSRISEAFPGITINRVWTYNNDDVKANVPNVMVEVPATPIGGTGKHWVIYIGNQQLYDPWTGTQRPTSDFPNPSGYCVVSGKWQQEVDQPSSTIPVDATVFPQIVHGSAQWDKTVSEYKPSSDPKQTQFEDVKAVITGKLSRLTDLSNQLTIANTQVTNLTEKVGRLQDQVIQVTEAENSLTDQLKKGGSINSDIIKVYQGQLDDKQKVIDRFAKDKGQLNTQLKQAQSQISTLKQNAVANMSTDDLIWLVIKRLFK